MAFWTQPLDRGIDIMPKMKDRFIIVFGGTDSSYAQNILFTAKSVTKPAISFETKEYQLINHKFKYPGLATWQPIKITFVDMGGTRHGPVGRNSSKKFGKQGGSQEALAQLAEQKNMSVEELMDLQNDSEMNMLRNEVAQIMGDSSLSRNAQHVADFLDDILQRSGYDRPTYHPGNTSSRKSMMNYYLSGLRIQQIDVTQSEEGLLITEEWELMNPIIKSISWGDLAYGEDGLVEYELELDYDYATFRYGGEVASLETPGDSN